jgi:hypothetical protein
MSSSPALTDQASADIDALVVAEVGVIPPRESPRMQ